MKNSELNEILKSAKVPERPLKFWEEFPRRVAARLHWKMNATEPRSQNGWPRIGWAFAGLTACLLVGFFVGHWRGHAEATAENNVLQNEKVIAEMLAMFPNRVRAVVQDEHGLNVVLSDKNDVPVSTPLWVKLCDGKHCSSVVTFSGQDIHVGQRKITVLADANGKIILAGDRFVWSAGEPALAASELKIEAKTLAPVLL